MHEYTPTSALSPFSFAQFVGFFRGMFGSENAAVTVGLGNMKSEVNLRETLSKVLSSNRGQFSFVVVVFLALFLLQATIQRYLKGPSPLTPLYMFPFNIMI